MVGQSIAHAAGAALTAQVKNTGQIVYCFFGDGASKQGAFFETLNLAAIWKLPVVFILENNDIKPTRTWAWRMRTRRLAIRSRVRRLRSVFPA